MGQVENIGDIKVDRKILVVDDEAPILDMLRRSFEGAGYVVLTASSAEEALDMLAAGQVVNVIFLDLKLPGMNGLQLCRRIKERNPIACLYAVTGYGSLFELADCREAGFDDYFTKPVKLGRLLKTAQDAFERLDRWTMARK